MKNKLFTLAAALMLAAVIGGVYAAPALAQVIKAALVKNVDEPGRSPYLQKVVCNGSGGCTAIPLAPALVPAGKRLVVDHISAFVSTPSFNRPYLSAGSANSSGGDDTRLAYVSIDSTVDTPSGSIFILSQPARFYVEAGKQPFLRVTSSESFLVDGYVSGYLIDATN
jgi:hypothetical protein